MKKGKLYIKIFISFVIVLIITEIVIFGLFILTEGRRARARVEGYVNAQSTVVRQYVEATIRLEPHVGVYENRSVKKLIHDLGNIYQAKVWITGTDGHPVMQSFKGPIPGDASVFYQKHAPDRTSNEPYHNLRRGFVQYVRMPVELQKGEKGNIHLLFENTGKLHSGGLFALGLLGIGLVIVLLVIPVSRRITNPLNRLRDSALKIADGDLTHRTTIKSKDEIGELGRAFNHMAAQLERMIRGGRELTANISHELRSPLTRIRIAEELIREKLDRGELQNMESHLDDIREDIEELDRLVGQVLVLSKMDILETTFNIEPVDISELLRDIIERLRLSISRKDLNLQTHIVCDFPVSGDREGLRTAFSNILENAAKFSPERGRINIRASSEENGVRISITNTFGALSMDDLARLFDPFYRVKPTRIGGSGLGLAITKKIIERHGGEIKAVNTPEGLKIMIHIPSRPPEQFLGFVKQASIGTRGWGANQERWINKSFSNSNYERYVLQGLGSNFAHLIRSSKSRFDSS